MKYTAVHLCMILFLTSCGGTIATHNQALSEIKADTDASSLQKLDNVKTMAASSTNVTTEQRAALQNALTKMEEFCSTRLSGMENDTKRKSKQAFWLSVAGAVSGAVIAPALIAGNAAANSVSVAAFSGFGGTTNFLSQSLSSSGLSGTSDANTRNSIVTTIWQKLSIAFDEQKPIGERLTAIDSAKAACVFYNIHVPSIPTSE